MKTSRLLAIVAALVSTSGPAWAATGEYEAAGRIVSIEILHYETDWYANRHGSMVLKVGATQQEYRWGGVTCAGATLPSEMVAALTEAQVHKFKVSPLAKDGAGDNKCVLGFKILK